MDDVQKQFLDIVMQVKTHLELQRALGVNSVETISAGTPAPARVVLPVKAQVSKAAPAKITPVAAEQRQGLIALQEELANCTRCTLSQSRTRVVFGEGNPEAVLVFIGEAPGREEEEQGRPLAGAAGQLLADIIVKGMKIKPEEVYICNVVKCRMPDDRKPAPEEIKSCEEVLFRQLQAIKPKIIVALGNTAVKALLKTNEGITTLRGTWQKYQGIPVMPTFHPAHLLKKESDKKLVWGDIQKVMAELVRFRKESIE